MKLRGLWFLAVPALVAGCDGRAGSMPAPAPIAATRGASPAPPAAAKPAPPKETTMAAIPDLTRGVSRMPEALSGRWRVARQGVVGDGIQAWGDDDPTLLGARLDIAADRAAFDAAAPAALEGACEGLYFDDEPTGAALRAAVDPWRPALTRMGAAAEGARLLRFICMDGGAIGPGADTLELLVLRDGRLAMPGRDNLLLLLTREPG